MVAVALVAYGILVSFIAPISSRVYYDPAMQYMLSSLSVFRGATYHYIDHPGTPVEILGTFVLALAYPFTSGTREGFVDFHLAHPEVFMTLVQSFLLIATLGVATLFAVQAVQVTDWPRAVAAIGLTGAFFGLHPNAFQTLAIWSHTSFNFIGGTLVSLLVLLAVRRAPRPRWREVLGLGFACGLLTSIQLYFAAWIIGAAVTFAVAAKLSGLELRYALRRGEATVAMAVLGFVTATLPIHDDYLQFAAWVWQLSDHQGIYGGGANGFSTPDLLASNLLTLVLEQPVLFGITLLGIGLLCVRSRRSSSPVIRAMSAGLLVQLLVLVLLIAKHPGPRYLLPIAATIPVVFATLLDSVGPMSSMGQWGMCAVGAAGFALFGTGFLSAITAHVELANALQRDDRGRQAWLETHGLQPSNTRTLWAYASPSQCYALWFGDWSSNHIFQGDLAAICPRDSNLDVWSRLVYSGKGAVPLENSDDWDLAAVPTQLVDMLPGLQSRGDAYQTTFDSIDDEHYGQLVFVARH